MVFAYHFLALIAHDIEKKIVDEGDHALRRELDIGYPGLNGLFEGAQFRQCRLLLALFIVVRTFPKHGGAPP